MDIIRQNSYELRIFEYIKDNITKLVDIGCRDNIDYFLSSPQCEMHLFDINKNHIYRIKDKIKNIQNKIYLYEFGLSNKNDLVGYSQISESIHRDFGNIINCPVKKFDDVLLEYNILNIDFLKMDIEGCEPEILFYKEILNNIKYIQFEYGNTWNLSEYNLSMCYIDYSDNFNFYFIKDINHPLTSVESSPILTFLDSNLIEQIDFFVSKDCGCNILMVNKKIKFDYESL
jgi:FkbM family methyltransferase